MSRTSFRAHRAVCVNRKNPLSPGHASLWKLSLLLVRNLLCAVFFVPLTNDYCQKPLNLLSMNNTTRTGRRELLELLQGFVFLKYLDRSNMPSKVV